MKKTLLAALVTIALTSLAFAHGNTVHISEPSLPFPTTPSR